MRSIGKENEDNLYKNPLTMNPKPANINSNIIGFAKF